MDTVAETFQTTDELQRQLGERVQAYRVNRNLSQEDVAAKAGVSLRAMRNLETSGRSSTATLLTVLRAMDVPAPLDSLIATPQVSPLAMLRSSMKPKRARKKNSSLK